MNVETRMIRPFTQKDFETIHLLNKEEGWTNLVEKWEDAKEAWTHSNIAFVTEVDGEVVGCIRGFTDGTITTFICEVLVAKSYRGHSIGRELLEYVHRLYPKTRVDLLASSTSKDYYEMLDFRAFYGYRKSDWGSSD